MVAILPTLILYSAGILSNKTGERNIRNSNRKGRSQIVPICRYMIPYLKDPKNSTKKLRSHRTFSKVAGYKINTKNQ
jgi:hypothetical protein